MSREAQGAWVCGPSRSGTSMVAGLLARHGVFFGRCRNPNNDNPKGFFENLYLKAVIAGREQPKRWPREWFEKLRDEGWDGTAPWGAKTGPERWTLIRPMRPSVIAVCQRPFEQIRKSRARTDWCQGPAGRAVTRSYDAVRELRAEVEVPVIDVHTDDLVRGAFGPVEEVLMVLGLELDLDVARGWVDPSIWNRP